MDVSGDLGILANHIMSSLVFRYLGYVEAFSIKDLHCFVVANGIVDRFASFKAADLLRRIVDQTRYKATEILPPKDLRQMLVEKYRNTNL